MRTAVAVLMLFGLGCLIAAAFSQETLSDQNSVVSYPVLSGVGLALRVSDGSVYVAKVLPDSVAERSNAIREGDQIVSVQSGDELVRLAGKTLGEAVSLIRGPVGSTTTLEIRTKKEGGISKVFMIREPIRLEGVPNTTYQELVGRVPPKLSFSKLDDSATVNLSEYHGKIVVVEFWATWCAACFQPVDELQELARSHPEWASRVKLLTISVEKGRIRAEEIIKQRKWTRTIHLSVDPQNLDAVGIHVLPVVMIVSPDGTIASMGGAHAIDVEKEIERLLTSPDY